MITRVVVQNTQGNTLSLTLQDTPNGYEVRDIQGLGPVKASLVSSQMAQVDGAQPQSSRRDTRNITMKIGFKPDYIQHSVSSLRRNLYNFFAPKAVIMTSWYDDASLYAVSTATVESCENNMFSDDPEVDLSLICYDPDFLAPAPIEVDGNTVPDLSVNTIHYTGTATVGIILEIAANRDMTGFQVYNTKPDNTVQKFDFEGQILNGDVVTITSIALRKTATITRSIQTDSALFYVQAPVDWITLDQGDNDIRVYSEDDPVPYTILYTPKYVGL